MLRIVSLNLNGIRSATTKGVWDWVAGTSPDVLCVQELKAQAADLDVRTFKEPLQRPPRFRSGRLASFFVVDDQIGNRANGVTRDKYSPDAIVAAVARTYSKWLLAAGRFRLADDGGRVRGDNGTPRVLTCGGGPSNEVRTRGARDCARTRAWR